MKNDWFTLCGDTFLWLNDKTGLVYNAENGKKLIFAISEGIKKICTHLLDINNLYTIELSDDIIADNEIIEWINSVVNIQAGFISSNINFENRPISLKSVLKIQDDRRYYEKLHNLGFKGKILENIHELTFYVNGNISGNEEYFKQTIYPVNSECVLNGEDIVSFIRNSINPFLSNINLVGDISLYPNFEKLYNDILSLSINVTIYILLEDYLNNMLLFKNSKCSESTRFNILIDGFFDVSFFQSVSLSTIFTVLIHSDKEFELYSKLFDNLDIDLNVQYVPIYNKENISFFESNIYLDEEDLKNLNVSKKEVFMHQALNTGNFGKLTIMPNGHVYANVNETSLGTINDSTYTIVYKEFLDGNSWFKLREQAPCNNCVYQWLCPSPSNYEIVINRPNLCCLKRM